jgi:hypothetical protein
MTELAVPPEDPSGEADARSSTLVLSDDQRQLEAMIAAALAVEHARLVPLGDARAAAGYAAMVVDNSRVLAAGNARVHLNLLRSQLRWARSLKPGELTW